MTNAGRSAFAVAICAVLAACSQAERSTDAAATGAGIAVGQIRTVGILGGGQGVLCPTSSGRLDEMVKAGSRDPDAYQEAVEDAATLFQGVKVRVVALDDPEHVELAVLTGNERGTNCWTRERPGLFK